MRITRIDHCLVRAPFREIIEWGSGTRIGTTRLLCRIETEGGHVGWGETLCLIDAVPAVFAEVVARLAPGLRVADVELLHRNVLGAGYYHHKRAAVMAIAALEMAMWDALGQITGRPLYDLWGGLWRAQVPAAAYLFTRDPARLRQGIAGFRDKGFQSFKVKIGFDAASDIALAEAARAAAGAADLRLDVNGAWTPGTARRQLTKLAGFDLQYVEQPLELDDLEGHRALRRISAVPIALDESAYTLQDVGNIIRRDAADVVLLDPHQAGGLWQVIKAAAVCDAVGIPVGLHSGAELALSQAAYVHLAAAIPNLSISIDTERTYLAADIAKAPVPLRDGAFAPPDAPGLGVKVDDALVDAIRVTRIEGAYLDPARPGWFPIKPAY